MGSATAPSRGGDAGGSRSRGNRRQTYSASLGGVPWTGCNNRWRTCARCTVLLLAGRRWKWSCVAQWGECGAPSQSVHHTLGAHAVRASPLALSSPRAWRLHPRLSISTSVVSQPRITTGQPKPGAPLASAAPKSPQQQASRALSRRALAVGLRTPGLLTPTLLALFVPSLRSRPLRTRPVRPHAASRSSGGSTIKSTPSAMLYL